MIRLLLALALACVLPSQEPPAAVLQLGSVITQQAVDEATVVQYRERGFVMAHLKDGQFTYSIATQAPPSFTTSWIDVAGMRQSVTTVATGNSVQAISTAVGVHNNAVAALKSIYPPGPNQGG